MPSLLVILTCVYHVNLCNILTVFLFQFLKYLNMSTKVSFFIFRINLYVSERKN